ncbi:MAG: C45 family peptidase [Candidatus Omnitrophica bacterium]|nr:C45 family peptidase [Candidatus Omnitrophota bacterium]
MKPFLISIISLFLLSGLFSGQAFGQEADIKLVKEFEGGKLYQAGGIDLLELNGSYHQMGRQYGGLLKQKIDKFYDLAIEKHYIERLGISYELIKGFSEEAAGFYPERFKALMTGLSQASGMPLEKILILEQILAIQFIQAEAGECSAIAAWGQYTGGQPLLLGRNYDSSVEFKDFSSFLNVVIYNPIDDIPVAVICYPGEVTSFTGINKNGIFFEINEGVKSGGNVIVDDRLILPVEAVNSLLDYTGFKEFDAAMNTLRSNYAFILQAADKEAAYSYELSVTDTKKREGVAPGILVATNHFIDPAWGLIAPDDSDDKTVQRRDNLLALADQYKGSITPDKMMRIMDRSFYDRGATWPERTAYQVIVEPDSNRLWIKVPDFQDWTEIKLDRYFKSSD